MYFTYGGSSVLTKCCAQLFQTMPTFNVPIDLFLRVILALTLKIVKNYFNYISLN